MVFFHLVSFWGLRGERRERPPEAYVGTLGIVFSLLSLLMC